jgi:hypothetical protein
MDGDDLRLRGRVDAVEMRRTQEGKHGREHD